MTLWAIQGDEHIRNTQLASRLTSYNDALFAKLEYIYKYCVEHKIPRLVKLGDTNTALNTDIKSVHINRYALLARKYKELEIDTILGNHDMYECNQDNLFKTSMLTLALTGAFNLWIRPIRFPEIQVQVLNVELEKSLKILEEMQESDVPTVIFGHHLFEWGLNPETCLNRKHFEKFASWKHPVTVFLGDDHTQYDPLKLPNVTIHRLGSIMRTEKPATDAPWQPRIAIFDTESLDVKYVSIPCEDYATAFGTPTSKMKFTSLANLDKLESALNGMGTEAGMSQELSELLDVTESIKQVGTVDYSYLRPSTVLHKLGCPAASIEYLRNLHESQGENF